MKYTSLLLFPLLVSAVPAPLPQADVPTNSNTAIVDLSSTQGPPQKLAAGIIYGVPDRPSQIPDKFYTEPGLRWFRASGAQTKAPSRGYAFGYKEYIGRFNVLKTQYLNSRRFNANHIVLFNDLWGTDGVQDQRTTPMPGDNGDWKPWDAFLIHFINDVNANKMTAGLYVDIWNEPELGGFWEGRSQEQWLQMWLRSYRALRKGLPSVKLIGPTLSGAPSANNSWWTKYLDYIKSTNTIPDQYVWHMEGGQGGTNAFADAVSALNSMLAQRGLPQRQININEYATFDEQNPASTAWWISQLERNNAVGLRGNWLMYNSLHDYLASLISKPGAVDGENDATYGNAGYFPNGDYQVYKYYNMNMTGTRLSTTSSTDGKLDVYSTFGNGKIKSLVGVSKATGTWWLKIQGLSSHGLPKAGKIAIQTYGFPFTGGHFGRVDAPKDLGVVVHDYSGDFVEFQIFQVDTDTAYTFEINVPR